MGPLLKKSTIHLLTSFVCIKVFHMKITGKSFFYYLLLFFMLIFSCTSMNAEASQTQAWTLRCSQCGGEVRVTTSRVYQHDETFTCVHYPTGKDTYKVYKVTQKSQCQSCGYTNTNSYEDHVLSSCSGR